MTDYGFEYRRPTKKEKLKFAFVLLSASLAVCCALFAVIYVNSSLNVTVADNSDTRANVSSGISYEPESAATFPLDINTCSESELTALPGIGEKTARRIAEYREASGGFSSVDELMNVYGIGEKKFEAIKEYVTVVN